jgi:phosphoribosylformylglycinamidine synthase
MPVFRVTVDVMPKPEVADPQGQAVEAALARLLGDAAHPPRHVRIGKTVRFELEAADGNAARLAVERLADRVLANPNTESYAIRMEAGQ